jgi:hypothetical protein
LPAPRPVEREGEEKVREKRSAALPEEGGRRGEELVAAEGR